jgi:hypothetical protein
MHELSVSATLHDIWSNGLTLASFVKGSIAKYGMPDYIFVTQRSERAISFIHDFNTFSCRHCNQQGPLFIVGTLEILLHNNIFLPSTHDCCPMSLSRNRQLLMPSTSLRICALLTLSLSPSTSTLRSAAFVPPAHYLRYHHETHWSVVGFFARCGRMPHLQEERIKPLTLHAQPHKFGFDSSIRSCCGS